MGKETKKRSRSGPVVTHLVKEVCGGEGCTVVVVVAVAALQVAVASRAQIGCTTQRGTSATPATTPHLQSPPPSRSWSASSSACRWPPVLPQASEPQGRTRFASCSRAQRRRWSHCPGVALLLLRMVPVTASVTGAKKSNSAAWSNSSIKSPGGGGPPWWTSW